MNNIRKLFWWAYSPTDEREEKLYLKAYKRFLVTFLFLVYIGLSGVFNTVFKGEDPASILNLDGLRIWVTVALAVSALSGWFLFRSEDIVLPPMKTQRNLNMVAFSIVFLLTAVIWFTIVDAIFPST